ncbi:RAMP superfamily CRISPR-associated protein [Paucidesulfovibrio longus]|uniref:RAMP superfamily CRISPR-associated protein n=1 Tax=Paucidesulfovibrio longus TaxID=889 RepID=UPI0003B5BC6D|nr:RAMP superfamily CRISPR-associated protein [Paucidesulfovibrio longus]
MTRLHEQVSFIRLEPLTPIHIGVGDSMDPLDYIMKEEHGQPFLYSVDVQAWVEAQANPVELAELFSRKSLTEIRSYLTKEISPSVDVFGGASARIASREVYDKYTQELRVQSSLNQLLIDPALKTPLTGALLIPGSSIKGAIRTAVIDWLDTNWSIGLKTAMNKDPKHGYTNALEGLLGKISDNDFRDLKVGDFPAAIGESVIVSAKEVRKRYKPEKQGTPKNPCEVSFSQVMSSKGYAVYGKIAVGAHGASRRDTALTISQGGRTKTWTLQQLMELCNEFYSKRYLDENARFYSQPHLSRTAEALGPIDPLFANPDPSAMLLRLGHYSHVECMTVSNNQPQTRRMKDGTFMPFGTTRTLADGVYPFGWARLTIINAEKYAQACSRREEEDAAFLSERTRRRMEANQRREAKARQKAEQERIEQERLAAEARRKAARESMTPEERLIDDVRSGLGNENQAVELYGKLDGLHDELRVCAARLLKAFWEKAGKWEKKKCTNKQWAKVQKVRDILGDE